MPNINREWEVLQEAFEASLKDVLGRLSGDLQEDLEGPVRLISQRLVVATKRRNWDLAEECRDQLALVAVENGLRAQYEGENLLSEMLDMVVSGLVKVATGALASVKIVG